MNLPRLTLVLGGANSGKSLFAERLVERAGVRPIYLATGRAYDAEMAAKIGLHIARRGERWQTVEAPLDLTGALQNVAPGTPVLVDCLTSWLSNHLIERGETEAACSALLADLPNWQSPVVIVSNEVGMGIVPDTPLGRQFRTAQGRINQDVAAKADLVVAVMAGLPLVLKGELP